MNPLSSSQHVHYIIWVSNKSLYARHAGGLRSRIVGVAYVLAVFLGMLACSAVSIHWTVVNSSGMELSRLSFSGEASAGDLAGRQE